MKTVIPSTWVTRTSSCLDDEFEQRRIMMRAAGDPPAARPFFGLLRFLFLVRSPGVAPASIRNDQVERFWKDRKMRWSMIENVAIELDGAGRI